MNFDQKIVTYRELSLQEQYHAVHEFQSHDYQYISAPLFLGVFARLSRLYHFLIPRRKNVDDIVTTVPAPATLPKSSLRSTIKSNNSYASTK